MFACFGIFLWLCFTPYPLFSLWKVIHFGRAELPLVFPLQKELDILVVGCLCTSVRLSQTFSSCFVSGVQPTYWGRDSFRIFSSGNVHDRICLKQEMFETGNIPNLKRLEEIFTWHSRRHCPFSADSEKARVGESLVCWWWFCNNHLEHSYISHISLIYISYISRIYLIYISYISHIYLIYISYNSHTQMLMMVL